MSQLSWFVIICPSVVCLSVCNVRAPYSADWNFHQCFCAIWYIGHFWPLSKNFTEIVPGNPSIGGIILMSCRLNKSLWCVWTATFWTNPQYNVSISGRDDDDDDDSGCGSVIVALMQKHRRRLRREGKSDLTIGYAVYKVHSHWCCLCGLLTSTERVRSFLVFVHPSVCLSVCSQCHVKTTDWSSWKFYQRFICGRERSDENFGSPSIYEFLKNFSTLQDKAFFHMLTRFCGKTDNWFSWKILSWICFRITKSPLNFFRRHPDMACRSWLTDILAHSVQRWTERLLATLFNCLDCILWFMLFFLLLRFTLH